MRDGSNYILGPYGHDALESVGLKRIKMLKAHNVKREMHKTT